MGILKQNEVKIIFSKLVFPVKILELKVCYVLTLMSDVRSATKHQFTDEHSFKFYYKVMNCYFHQKLFLKHFLNLKIGVNDNY